MLTVFLRIMYLKLYLDIALLWDLTLHYHANIFEMIMLTCLWLVFKMCRRQEYDHASVSNFDLRWCYRNSVWILLLVIMNVPTHLYIVAEIFHHGPNRRMINFAVPSVTHTHTKKSHIIIWLWKTIVKEIRLIHSKCTVFFSLLYTFLKRLSSPQFPELLFGWFRRIFLSHHSFIEKNVTHANCLE